MNESTIKIRLMKADDFDAVVEIDGKVLKASRPEYYEMIHFFSANQFSPSKTIYLERSL